MPVEPFQARVAQLALSAAAAEGFALAGGNVLAAHGLLSRPTEDVDLFSPLPGGPGRVVEAVEAALMAHGFDVQVVRSPAEHSGEFAQLQVSREGRTTQLDLGRDWRAHDVVTFEIGPVLHLEDAVGSKVTAMLGRGLPRDYIDVAAALRRFSRARLLELAFERDPGLRVDDVALAMGRLDRLGTEPFQLYGLQSDDVDALRDQFQDWPRGSAPDEEARAARQRPDMPKA